MAAACTVVITTKDRWGEIDIALTSMARQSIEPECLVVDDGSAVPAPPRLAEKFPFVRFIRNEKSLGIVPARNAAARLITTPYFAILDDDAEYTDANVLRDAVKLFERSQVAIVSIPHTDIVGGREFQRTQRQIHGIAASFTGCANVIRTETFKKHGGFRELYFRQGEEEDLCLRLFAENQVVAVLGRMGVIHRPSPVRNIDEMDFFGPRNQVLLRYLNCNNLLFVLWTSWGLAKLSLWAIRWRRLRKPLEGWLAGIRATRAFRDQRRILPFSTVLRYEALKRGVWVGPKPDHL